MYKVVIVDDEPGPLSLLSKMVNGFFNYEVVGTYSTSDQLLDNIYQIKPHVLFLDIHLREKSGLDIARELFVHGCNTKIVFVSAYDKYALEAFEYNIIDYILKPVSRERLQKSLQKIDKLLEMEHNASARFTQPSTSQHNLIKFNTLNGFILIDPSDIVYLRADHMYTKIVFASQEAQYITQNLGKVLPLLNKDYLLRISRSLVINVNYLREVNRTQRQCIMNDGQKDIALKITKPAIKRIDDYFQ